MAVNRLDRVNEVLRRELGTLLPKRLQLLDLIVTVVDVTVSADLKHADVYLSILGATPADEAFVMGKIFSARSDIQAMIGKRVPMKFTPRLHFKLDHTTEKATQMVQLLDEIEEEDRKRPDHQ